MTDLFSAAILLVLVLDPFGNLPLVVSALARVPSARHAPIVLRECLFAYVLLLAFMAGGRTFMQWLQLSDVSLSIAGGIILFLIALRMVFPHRDGIFGEMRDGEPFLVPLAVPSIAGPSALATVMLMASRDPVHLWTWVLALTLAMALTTVVLLSASRLQAVLGERAIGAFERLMGLVLTAVAVQMLLNGVREFLAQLGK
ncbi:MAG TPA: MarC family protein [Casimicrobiaceae bacterium]|nr:MarC family protein [Casimicrobiaceae bacterium]